MRHMTLFALAVALQSAITAWGATIIVDTTDPAPVPDGLCSLVEAIDNANADAAVSADCPAGSGADVIELAEASTYTFTEVHSAYNGPNGLPYIQSEISINGHGSTLERGDGSPPFRLLAVAPAGVFELFDLTLRGGDPREPYHGGALFSAGTTTLVRTTVTENAGQCGGGLRNSSGTMTIVDSTITQNTGNHGGGICSNAVSAHALLVVERTLVTNNISNGEGGGIQAVRREDLGWMSTLRVAESTVSGNSAVIGSGGITSEGDITLTDSTISDNHAGLFAGGLYVGRGAADIERSTITGNTVETTADIGGAGGGVVVNDASATISNSTISGNHALGAATNGDYSGRGGGVLLIGWFADTVVNIEDSTICDNTAEFTGGGIGVMRLGGGTFAAELTLRDTVVADNLELGGTFLGNCSEETGATVTSGDFNLADDLTCNLLAPDDMVVADVMLDPLAAYGGPTMTHRPMPGSPAIDSGDDDLCPNSDQRGAPRPIDGDGDGSRQCDRGSVEFGVSFMDGFESGDTSVWSTTVP